MGGGITKSLHIPDETGVMVYRSLTAKYNENRDCFTVKVPAYLRGSSTGWSKSGDGPWEATDTEDTIDAKSPAILFKTVEEAGKKYVESLKSKVKVIGYNVEYAINANIDIDVEWEEKNASRDGTSLKISWEIGYKIEIGKKSSFQKGENGGYMREPDNWIAWTEEREKFFIDTETALATLALRFNEFFVKKSKALGGVIDAAPRTLLIAQEKRNERHR